MTLEEFLRETDRRRKNSKKGIVVFSQAERSFAIMFARKKLSKGISQSKISAQLGIGNSTLYSWLGSPPKRKKGFKRVKVKPDVLNVQPIIDNNTVTIISPRGFRLEGIRLDKAVALLSELG